MKFTLAILAYLLIGLVLGLGIFLAVKGSFALLVVATILYIIGFARIGCAQH